MNGNWQQTGEVWNPALRGIGVEPKKKLVPTTELWVTQGCFIKDEELQMPGIYED